MKFYPEILSWILSWNLILKSWFTPPLWPMSGMLQLTQLTPHFELSDEILSWNFILNFFILKFYPEILVYPSTMTNVRYAASNTAN